MDRMLAAVSRAGGKISHRSATGMNREIMVAKQVFVAGAGRSGLLAQAFAMRLLHLGFKVYVTGEVVTPAIASGDLLICCSGSGETETTIHFAEVARKVGARLCVITARSNSTLSGMADCAVLIPAWTGRGMGQSLFEQTLFFFLEKQVARLKRKKSDKPVFSSVHANLE